LREGVRQLRSRRVRGEGRVLVFGPVAMRLIGTSSAISAEQATLGAARKFLARRPKSSTATLSGQRGRS
jgi:hypothetical protein